MRRFFIAIVLVLGSFSIYKMGPAALSSLPFSSERIGPPKGVAPGGPAIAFVQTRPEEVLSLPSGPMYFPPMGVYLIKEGRAVGRDGDIITSEDKILLGTTLHTDLQLRSPEQIANHHLLRRFKLPKVQSIKGRVAVIASGSATCYAHWMADALPKIKILEETNLPYDKLYIASPKRTFHLPSLEALNIPKEKILFADKNTHIKADEIVAITLPTAGSKIPPWVSSFLKTTFLVNEPSESSEKIFISREKSRRHSISDEEKIWTLLKKEGFKKVYSEDLTLSQQAKLFASAQVIVAQHGAGLVNLSFCKKRTQVVELFPSFCAPRCFEDLAKTLDLPYKGIHCLKKGAEGNYLTDDLSELKSYIRSFNENLEEA